MYDMHADFTPAEKRMSFWVFVLAIAALLMLIVVLLGFYMAPALS